MKRFKDYISEIDLQEETEEINELFGLFKGDKVLNSNEFDKRVRSVDYDLQNYISGISREFKDMVEWPGVWLIDNGFAEDMDKVEGRVVGRDLHVTIHLITDKIDKLVKLLKGSKRVKSASKIPGGVKFTVVYKDAAFMNGVIEDY